MHTAHLDWTVLVDYYYCKLPSPVLFDIGMKYMLTAYVTRAVGWLVMLLQRDLKFREIFDTNNFCTLHEFHENWYVAGMKLNEFDYGCRLDYL